MPKNKSHSGASKRFMAPGDAAKIKKLLGK